MQTLQHSALKHSISRCLRRLASPAKQSTITAERYKSLHKTLSPVTFRKSFRCGPFEAKQPKRYETPTRYGKHPRHLYLGFPPSPSTSRGKGRYYVVAENIQNGGSAILTGCQFVT